MQISERFRRGVVVPLDDAAARAMERNDVAEATCAHFVGIANQAEFEALWKTGVFEAINKATGSMIDDYEEVEIASDTVPRVREVAASYARSGAGGPMGTRFFAALISACEIAERERMPIYFVL